MLERKLAAVSLAAQLYRAEHGRWPPSVDALVPEYLPEVPMDPLSGAPVRWAPPAAPTSGPTSGPTSAPSTQAADD